MACASRETGAFPDWYGGYTLGWRAPGETGDGTVDPLCDLYGEVSDDCVFDLEKNKKF